MTHDTWNFYEINDFAIENITCMTQIWLDQCAFEVPTGSYFFQDVSREQDWGENLMVGGQWSLSVQSGRMRNWIFLPCTLSCVFSLQLLGESLTTRRRGRAAQYWNLTGSGLTTRSTREVKQFRSLGQSFPLALPSGSLFSVSILPLINLKSISLPAVLWDCDKRFQLQRGGVPGHPIGLPHHLPDSDPGVPVVLHIKRGPDQQVGGNWRSVGGRVLLKPSKECRQSAENAESFTWHFFQGWTGWQCLRFTTSLRGGW